MIVGPLRDAMLVGAGGFLGSILRWSVSGLVHRWIPAGSYPWGTTAVNVLGCLAIGVLTGLAESRQLFRPEARLFLFLGLLGGFTTFSTFGHETLALLRDGENARALANVLVQVIAGLGAVWLGYAVASAA